MVKVTDACGAFITSDLDVYVTNTPPYYPVTNYPELVVPMNSVYTFTMTDLKDAEGHYIYLSLLEYGSLTGPLLSNAPSFATIVPGSHYRI